MLCVAIMQRIMRSFSAHLPPDARHALDVFVALACLLACPSPVNLQIIHFCSSPKPWEEPKRKGDLEMIWWQRYLQMKVGSMPGMGGF